MLYIPTKCIFRSNCYTLTINNTIENLSYLRYSESGERHIFSAKTVK